MMDNAGCLTSTTDPDPDTLDLHAVMRGKLPTLIVVHQCGCQSGCKCASNAKPTGPCNCSPYMIYHLWKDGRFQ